MRKTTYLLFAILFFLGCSASQKTITSTDDGKIEIVFLQVNDVYEIAPLPGDNRGGMARIATLKKQLLNQNKNTYTIMAGDFLSPSVIGTLHDEKGQSIKGAHMVDVMNTTGIDLVTFGNHEFDLKEKDLQKRLDESEFGWVSSNVLQVHEGKVNAFFKNKNEKRKAKEYIPEIVIKTFTDGDGTTITVGFFGVTIDAKKRKYIAYEDPFQRAKAMFKKLYPQVDIIIPITHLNIA
ncbi:MAG TPA: bifunctional metallophosphatase/5'-nucleotidase, partial [Phaeodactylibacter sp.]|nr:bifunctional metallophosphatase/5'-nucleotidase [Phaeodactylibacter sp.]